MDIQITPSPLKGTVAILPSKSHSHRLLMAEALAGMGGHIQRPGVLAFEEPKEGADIQATKACLAQLFSEDLPVLHCGESGSTLRFLLPVAAALREEAIFLGMGRLPERPLSPLKEELEAHGCIFEETAGCPSQREAAPICKIKGRLQSGIYTLPGNVSSQYITGLLFALPLLAGDSQIRLTSSLESAGYVDMTLQVLSQYGVQVNRNQEPFPVYTVGGGQKYTAPPIPPAPEGDWSNAAFWLAAGPGVQCTGLNPHSTQGDKAILSLLTSLQSDESRREIDAGPIPDLIPILSIVAATANGTTVIQNAGRLRIKESDRLRATTDLLTRLGGDVTELADGLIIGGKSRLAGGAVDGCNDHRMVMSAAIASIHCTSPVIIRGAEAINKSYPDFWDEFVKLGGRIHVL